MSSASAGVLDHCVAAIEAMALPGPARRFTARRQAHCVEVSEHAGTRLARETGYRLAGKARCAKGLRRAYAR